MQEGDGGRRGQQGPKCLEQPFLSSGATKSIRIFVPKCLFLALCVCECDSVCVTRPSAPSRQRGAEMGSDNCPTSGLPWKYGEQLCPPQLFLEKPNLARWATPTASSTHSSMSQLRLLCSQRHFVMELHPPSNKLDSKPISPPECIFWCL